MARLFHLMGIGIHHFWLFVAAGLLLNVTPGPDTFYILGRSISQGRAAGILSALAISTGCLFHTTAAALGLSVILARSAIAFEIIRYAGAAYLAYLGLRLMLAKSADAGNGESLPRASLWTIYRQGVLTNVLNPKVALFFRLLALHRLLIHFAPSSPGEGDEDVFQCRLAD